MDLEPAIVFFVSLLNVITQSETQILVLSPEPYVLGRSIRMSCMNFGDAEGAPVQFLLVRGQQVEIKNRLRFQRFNCVACLHCRMRLIREFQLESGTGSCRATGGGSFKNTGSTAEIGSTVAAFRSRRKYRKTQGPQSAEEFPKPAELARPALALPRDLFFGCGGGGGGGGCSNAGQEAHSRKERVQRPAQTACASGVATRWSQIARGLQGSRRVKRPKSGAHHRRQRIARAAARARSHMSLTAWCNSSAVRWIFSRLSRSVRETTCSTAFGSAAIPVHPEFRRPTRQNRFNPNLDYRNRREVLSTRIGQGFGPGTGGLKLEVELEFRNRHFCHFVRLCLLASLLHCFPASKLSTRDC